MKRTSILLSLLLCVAACGEEGEQGHEHEDTTDAAGAPVCGGHGSIHGEHCHCEDGWAPATDSCVSIDALPVCASDTPEKASCRCEPPNQECACPDHTEKKAHVGAYYCEEELH